jgi:class 3 adenylate cyclase
MFCDMVDSTSLSAQFDPEDVRDMIASFRETCVRVVKHYEGFAARFVGDGILVYFGYPTAHEDDAERAVRAGLEIVRVLSSARAIEPRGALSHAPAVRIGIATGLVVVGDLVGQGTEERDSAVGETVNLAARLQGLAPPNGVVIARRRRLRSPSGRPSSTRSASVRSGMMSRSRRCCAKRSVYWPRPAPSSQCFRPPSVALGSVSSMSFHPTCTPSKWPSPRPRY